MEKDAIRAALRDIIIGGVLVEKSCDKVIEEFLLIPRSELPTTYLTYGHEPGGVEIRYVNVDGADHSRWRVDTSSSRLARQTGLEYLVAAEALDTEKAHLREENAAQKQLDARRESLVLQHGGALGVHHYSDLDTNQKYLIDRLRQALDGEDK